MADRIAMLYEGRIHRVGTPEEIKRQARFAIRHCAPGGGFILGSSHNIMIATRYENFMAMLEVAFEEGRYG